MITILKNLRILIWCYVQAWRNGHARKTTRQPRTVLVMPASRLGDMICATPIFHAIKVKYPGCKVIVLGLANCTEVHEHNPDVDAYVALSTVSFTENVATIRALNADVAIITTPSFEGSASCICAGIRTVIGPYVVNGFSPYQTISYRLLFPLFISIRHRIGSYAPREYLDMLKPLDITAEDTKKHVFYSDASKAKMGAYLKAKGIHLGSDLLVGISISAGNKIKKWLTERFGKLADRLAATHQAVIIFIGSSADMPETEQLITRLDTQTRFVNSTGICTIDELKALMSFFDLFISVDTGPVYIAEALNVPTVDITGPIDEKEQPPHGPLNKSVFIRDRVKPELYVMNARSYNEAEAKRQVEGITVDAVVKAAEEIITLIS